MFVPPPALNCPRGGAGFVLMIAIELLFKKIFIALSDTFDSVCNCPRVIWFIWVRS